MLRIAQATFVNAFVNAGFGTDKLLTAAEESPESVSWIYKNKARTRKRAGN